MELRAGPGVVQHQPVQLGLGQGGVPQSLFDLGARDEGEVAEVTGHVDDPGLVRQEGQEGIAHVLQAPIVDIQCSLDLRAERFTPGHTAALLCHKYTDS